MLLVKQSEAGQSLQTEDVWSLLYSLVDVVMQFGFDGKNRFVKEVWYDPSVKRRDRAAKFHKLIVVSLLGVVAVAYLGAYFFPAFLKARSHGGLSVDDAALRLLLLGQADVRSRLIGAGARRFSSSAAWRSSSLAETAQPAWRCPLGDGASYSTRRPDVRPGHHSGTLQESLSCVAGPNRRHLGGAAALGKGVSCVIPNLLNWPGSVLGPRHQEGKLGAHRGYRSLFSEVYLFDPILRGRAHGALESLYLRL
jgi:hypothetical protein